MMNTMYIFLLIFDIVLGFGFITITIYFISKKFSHKLNDSVSTDKTEPQMIVDDNNKDKIEQLRNESEKSSCASKGTTKNITALFTNIQKFIPSSESITKIYGEEGNNKLIVHLNDYLGAMANEILNKDGSIDKFNGGAISSMFGAPDPMGIHTKEEWAYLALDSAIHMKKIEKKFNEEHEDFFRTYDIQKEDGYVEKITINPIQTRIGINSGDAFVGLVGNLPKINYTMIGETVNIAEILERLNSIYGSWILCSEVTWNMANTGANKGKIIAKRLDQIRVTGCSTLVQLYNIIGFADELTTVQKEEINLFHAALEKYLQKDFETAGKMFLQASSMVGEDPTAMVFAVRCKEFIEKGIPENWDGIVNITFR